LCYNVILIILKLHPCILKLLAGTLSIYSFKIGMFSSFNCSDDITFVDPLNTFHGIDNYKTVFWALRFHGRLLFSEIVLDVSRIWQLTENSIVVRWELWGTPRVPWEPYGSFSGTSRYKVDRNGKIYEHKVDNLALDFPRSMAEVGSIADMVAATCPPSPNLTFWDVAGTGEDCSWAKLYEAVVEAVEREGHSNVGIGLEGLVTCS
jgi:hypothetical protein